MRTTNTNHQQYFNDVREEHLLQQSQSRGRVRRKSAALVDHYASSKGSVGSVVGTQNMNIFGDLMRAAETDMAVQFQNRFMFGVQLWIWRKGKKKNCTFFVDQYMPSFIWISTHSKAFLFDLAFTTIHRFDYDLQLESKIKHYFILTYFEEQIPVIFEGFNAIQDSHRFYELFHNYITYNRIMVDYPSFFSKILKKSVIEDIKEDIVRSQKAIDVIKVSEDISWNFKEFSFDVMRFILNRKGAGSNLQTVLTHEEMSNYYKISSCCQQLKGIFEQYAGVKFNNYFDYLSPSMPKQAFLAFLSKEQGQSKQFIEDFVQSGKDAFSFYDFSLYILNEKDNYAASIGEIDENLPLTDYYCYSSHNTYLSGNQLTSDSKIDRYLEDLDNGLKCVELDVHNDGTRPIITHAFKDKSLNKQIDFEQTLNAIAGFCNQNKNHYPIILSIQNHANQSNRVRMLNIIIKAFGQKLLLVNNQMEMHNLTRFRTLRQLKGKVIIKSSSKISEIKNIQNSNKMIPQQVQMMNNLNPNNNSIYDFQFSRQMQRAPFPSQEFDQRYHQFQQEQHNYNIRKQDFQGNIQKQLYLPLQEMTKVTSIFKAPEGIQTLNSNAFQCTSLTNQKAMKANENFIIDYTKRSWLRIYPLATEINSGNFDIVPHLRIGAQIIALNTQTKDEFALMQMSYFTAGQQLEPIKLGYIPKPIHLLSGSQYQRQRVIKLYNVKVYSNETIKIDFFGSKQDMKMNSKSNTSFTVGDYLEGFLIFSIGEHYKDCIPLRFLKQGFRVLIAKNEFFRDSGKRILIHISVKDQFR